MLQVNTRKAIKRRAAKDGLPLKHYIRGKSDLPMYFIEERATAYALRMLRKREARTARKLAREKEAQVRELHKLAFFASLLSEGKQNVEK